MLACTLFALFVLLPRAGQKRKVCANAWLIGGLNCRVAICLSVAANGRILNAKARILLANDGFIFANVSFLKSDARIQSTNGKSLNTVAKSLSADGSLLKAKGSFHIAIENSLLYLVKILHDRCKIQIAYTSAMHTKIIYQQKVLGTAHYLRLWYHLFERYTTWS